MTSTHSAGVPGTSDPSALAGLLPAWATDQLTERYRLLVTARPLTRSCTLHFALCAGHTQQSESKMAQAHETAHNASPQKSMIQHQDVSHGSTSAYRFEFSSILWGWSGEMLRNLSYKGPSGACLSHSGKVITNACNLPNLRVYPKSHVLWLVHSLASRLPGRQSGAGSHHEFDSC